MLNIEHRNSSFIIRYWIVGVRYLNQSPFFNPMTLTAFSYSHFALQKVTIMLFYMLCYQMPLPFAV